MTLWWIYGALVLIVGVAGAVAWWMVLREDDETPSDVPPGWESCGDGGAYCPTEEDVEQRQQVIVDTEPVVVSTWCQLQPVFVGNEINAYTLKQQWSDGRITSNGWC
jgi:hypothetical protein